MAKFMGKPKIRGLCAATWMAVASLVAIGPLAAQPAAGEFVVRQTEGAPTMSIGGTVIPYKEVTLSAQLPGRINYLAGIEGDKFKKGDLLAAIDDQELLANRRAILAKLAAADSQLRNAGMQYSREIYSPRSRTPPGGMAVPNLFDQMFTRPMEDFMGQRSEGAEITADLYASGTQVEQARSTLMASQAELQALDAKLRDARSIAPFDGVIIKKFVEIGDTLQPGQPMLTYADVEYLQVEIDVPSRLRPGLREGMMIHADLDVGHERVPVRVAQIFPVAAVIEFLSSFVTLEPGDIITSSPRRVAIPSSPFPRFVTMAACRGSMSWTIRATPACAWCAWASNSRTAWCMCSAVCAPASASWPTLRLGWPPAGPFPRARGAEPPIKINFAMKPAPSRRRP